MPEVDPDLVEFGMPAEDFAQLIERQHFNAQYVLDNMMISD